MSNRGSADTRLVLGTGTDGEPVATDLLRSRCLVVGPTGAGKTRLTRSIIAQTRALPEPHTPHVLAIEARDDPDPLQPGREKRQAQRLWRFAAAAGDETAARRARLQHTGPAASAPGLLFVLDGCDELHSLGPITPVFEQILLDAALWGPHLGISLLITAQRHSSIPKPLTGLFDQLVLLDPDPDTARALLGPHANTCSQESRGRGRGVHHRPRDTASPRTLHTTTHPREDAPR